MNFKQLVSQIEETHSALQQRAVAAVDVALVIRNWLIGRHIVEYEQKGADRAAYGERLMPQLAETFAGRTRGFSLSNLKLMRQFFLLYPQKGQTLSGLLDADGPRGKISQTASGQWRGSFPLNWSHYVFLMQTANVRERGFYEIESAKENWSIRELKRQFNSSLYERLALSRDKKQVRSLSLKGHIIASPQDAVKDPYVLEFLGLREETAYSESDLESAIIDKLEHFLLELGKGFLFEARQKRITFNEEHYFADLVFYNRLLRCYVVIDLKIGKLAHQDMGQLQMYVNYFDRHVKTKDEGPTIGILLCKTKSDALVEMTLPKGNRTIFASRYQLYLPSKEELRKQIRTIPDGPGGKSEAMPRKLKIPSRDNEKGSAS